MLLLPGQTASTALVSLSLLTAAGKDRELLELKRLLTYITYLYEDAYEGEFLTHVYVYIYIYSALYAERFYFT